METEIFQNYQYNIHFFRFLVNQLTRFMFISVINLIGRVQDLNLRCSKQKSHALEFLCIFFTEATCTYTSLHSVFYFVQLTEELTQTVMQHQWFQTASCFIPLELHLASGLDPLSSQSTPRVYEPSYTLVYSWLWPQPHFPIVLPLFISHFTSQHAYLQIMIDSLNFSRM